MTKHIVLMGGWSGVSNLLQAFSLVPEWRLSAIVATSDDGGSTGVIRDSYPVPAIGDIVKNLSALGWETTQWLTYRHQDGFLSGHTTGNLWLLGLMRSYGISEGLKKAHTLLWYDLHRIIPATRMIHDIRIRTTDGEEITGEGPIIQCTRLAHAVEDIALFPCPSASEEAVEALGKADAIVLGPGTLYTSLIACLLPVGMSEAFNASKAQKFFIMNGANFPPGHCDGYTLESYLEEIRRWTGIQGFDAILAHDGSGVPPEQRIAVSNHDGHVNMMDVLDTPANDPGGRFDSIKRSTLRHDGKKVAEWIKKYFQ